MGWRQLRKWLDPGKRLKQATDKRMVRNKYKSWVNSGQNPCSVAVFASIIGCTGRICKSGCSGGLGKFSERFVRDAASATGSMDKASGCPGGTGGSGIPANADMGGVNECTGNAMMGGETHF